MGTPSAAMNALLVLLSVLCSALVASANLADDPSNAIFKIGSPLVINCAIEKPESVVWTKNNSTEVVLKENLVTVTVENAVSVLRFEKPKIDEIGTYTCTSGEKSLTFTSYMEPYITKFPPSANVVEGEKYKLKCEAYGEPEPVIEWQKCGVPLVPEDYRVTVTDDTLSILEMNVTDACNYTCTATSSLGSFSLHHHPRHRQVRRSVAVLGHLRRGDH